MNRMKTTYFHRQSLLLLSAMSLLLIPVFSFTNTAYALPTDAVLSGVCLTPVPTSYNPNTMDVSAGRVQFGGVGYDVSVAHAIDGAPNNTFYYYAVAYGSVIGINAVPSTANPSSVFSTYPYFKFASVVYGATGAVSRITHDFSGCVDYPVVATPTISVTCSASKSQVAIGEDVTFTATATLNVVPAHVAFGFNDVETRPGWRIDVPPYTKTFSKSYSTAGDKTMTVRALAGGFAGVYADTVCGTVKVSAPNPGGNNPPVITLVGSNPISLLVGQTFADPGATATDVEDGNITSRIVPTGPVDTGVAGTYTITYRVTDSSGLSVSVTRNVIVTAPIIFRPPSGGGGGLNQPNVVVSGGGQGTVLPAAEVAVLTSAPFYVYLSQVPYTGFGDPERLVSFMALMSLWSGAVVCLVRARGRKKF